MKTRHNPERRTFRGKSYRKGTKLVVEVKVKAKTAADKAEDDDSEFSGCCGCGRPCMTYFCARCRYYI